MVYYLMIEYKRINKFFTNHQEFGQILFIGHGDYENFVKNVSLEKQISISMKL